MASEEVNEEAVVEPETGLGSSLGEKPESGESEPGVAGGGAEAGALSAAQRARIERNRARARSLHHARLVHRSALPLPTVVSGQGIERAGGAGGAGARVVDTGGGFLCEEAEAAPARAARLARPSAPIVHRADQPHCDRCARPFPQSYLLDTFDLTVCDACRDDAEADELVARTDAKAEYLLKDCDLDSRVPALRCVRRRNPHSSRYGDMRLYLRAQVAARALLVWGSEEALEAERARRGEARARALHARTHRRLRALRMDVRSSLYRRTTADEKHTHTFAAETYHEATDLYERTCTQCSHTETYEKM